ncbi:MAG: MFS transporter, partial [Chloroflexota bacterium]
REQTVTTLAAISLTTAIAQLPAGWLADVFPLRWLAFVNMVLQATSLVLLLFVSSFQLAFAYAILAGLAVSVHNGVIGPLWARYFGREHLGKIRGSIFTSTVAGSSLGPFVMGALFDLTGSYSPSIIIFAVIYGVFAVLTPLARRPELTN